MSDKKDPGHVPSELQDFVDEWKNELSHRPPAADGKPDNTRPDIISPDKKCAGTEQHPIVSQAELLSSSASTSYDETPFPFQFTDSLLRSWHESPPCQTRSGKRKLKSSSPELSGDSPSNGAKHPEPRKKLRRSMLDIFIDDLNELDDVPFFDISLPKEIAVRIFEFLETNDLCSCSQVSKAWRSIADDNLIWERIYHRIQSTFSGHTLVTESANWKQTVRDSYTQTRTLLLNWKEHKCHITYYHHARGGILTSAHCIGDTMVAGFTNGQVKMWNIISQDTQTFEPSNKSLQLIHEDDENVLATSENSVTCVRLSKSGRLIAGYRHGQVQVWNPSDADSMLVSDFPGYSVQEVILQSGLGYAHINSTSNAGCMVKVMRVADGSIEVTDSLVICGDEVAWTIPKQLMAPLPLPHSQGSPLSLIYLGRDSLNLHQHTDHAHTSGYSSGFTKLEEFYATHFTCLETSQHHVNLGFTSHLGLQAEYKVRIYDTTSLRHCSDLRGHTSQVTCIDNSFPSGSLIATGCFDRRVRLYDTRMPTCAVHTYTGHSGSVQCVQCDDWKVVSGDMEGYICVWDQRMGSKFWESQSRHPVKFLRFTCNHLISANIPLHTPDEQFDCDRMTHLRYRGRLQVSNFSVEHSSSELPSICSSSYDAPEASNYNLSLITPYDSI